MIWEKLNPIHLGKHLLQLVLPKICAACKRPLIDNEEIICNLCLVSLPYTRFYRHESNPINNNLVARCGISSAHSLLHFRKGGCVQLILHQLKYKANFRAGKLLGILMADYIRELNEPFDSVIGVPLHPEKLKKRGYNQCDIIVETLAKELHLEICNNTIKRIEHSESQTQMDRYERWQNSQTLFQLQNIEKVSNKNVLVIDDVFTTGATMESICREVLKGKPKKLVAMTAAYADY